WTRNDRFLLGRGLGFNGPRRPCGLRFLRRTGRCARFGFLDGLHLDAIIPLRFTRTRGVRGAAQNTGGACCVSTDSGARRRGALLLAEKKNGRCEPSCPAMLRRAFPLEPTPVPRAVVPE